jgi:hypothetical protein
VKTCTLYKTHQCAVLENHHICPESWWLRAGKHPNSPMAMLCPNCHMNVHAALDAMLKGPIGKMGFPPRIVKLAIKAMAIAGENDLTPYPTL